MAIITINNRKVDIDIRAELEQFEWNRAKWSHDKLIAASPFRYDSTPSFYAYLEDTLSAKAGYWGDSGYIDPNYAKGGLIQLLAFLRAETEQETIDYLLEKYGEIGAYEYVSKPLDLSYYQCEKSIITLEKAVLNAYKYRHPYLAKRGISEQVQRAMNVGYDRASNAVTFAWFDASGRLRNIKYRRTDSKIFWYYKGGEPIRNLVYGIDFIYKWRKTSAILCEAEIDALTCMTHGYPAIAVGGSSFNRVKADIIARSPIERLYIATDNDEAGEKLRRQVNDMLRREVELYNVYVPRKFNDINEFANNFGNIREIVEKSEKASLLKFQSRICINEYQYS